jgi:hypothetical protein
MLQDGLVAAIEFFGNSRRRQQRQGRMRLGVISKRVTSLGNFPGKPWNLANVASNQKKCSFRFVPGQQIKQLRRYDRVRAIIKGQSHARCITGVPHGVAEKPR